MQSTTGDYEERVHGLLTKVMYEDLIPTQVEEILMTWDPDEIRAFSLTTQQLYRIARSTWIDVVTRPKES